MRVTQTGFACCTGPIKVDIQATFNYFGQVNPLRVALVLEQKRAHFFDVHKVVEKLSPEVFRQSTILNQADVGNELVPLLQIYFADQPSMVNSGLGRLHKCHHTHGYIAHFWLEISHGSAVGVSKPKPCARPACWRQRV